MVGRIVGLMGHAKRYSATSLSDFLSDADWVPHVGPPEYINATVGPDRTLPCLDFALLLVTSPHGPLALFVRRSTEHGPMAPQLAIQVTAADGEGGAHLIGDLRRLMDEHDVYRGQVLTVKGDPHGGRDLVFLRRPSLAADEVILPDGVLDRIERHVVGPGRHRDAAAERRSPPLARAAALGAARHREVAYRPLPRVRAAGHDGRGPERADHRPCRGFRGLAKRLAPSLVVLEDVDLVAQERTYGPFRGRTRSCSS